jgi:hypothetical protein
MELPKVYELLAQKERLLKEREKVKQEYQNNSRGGSKKGHSEFGRPPGAAAL